MKKIFLATRDEHRDALLALLGTVGVLHVEPVDPDAAAVQETVRQQLSLLERVPLHLGTAAVEPAGDPPDLAPLAAAHRIEKLANRLIENEHEVHALHQAMAELGPWGNVAFADLDDLGGAGCRVALLVGPTAALDDLVADCQAFLGHHEGKVLVAAANPAIPLPEGVVVLERPERDRTSLQAEVALRQQQIRTDRDGLAALAGHVDAIAAHHGALAEASLVDCVRRSGYEDEAMYAVQGWLPADGLNDLDVALKTADFAAGFVARDPLPDETPPTEIRYPRWARPIQGLFRILGSVAGYDEADVSPVFIIALPIFCALLICDWGYGLMLAALSVVMAKSIRRSMGLPFLNLVRIIAVAVIVWGVLINSFFGADILPFRIVLPIGDGVPLVVDKSPVSQNLMMFISFTLALAHLATAWLWQAVRQYPRQTFISSLGWCGIVVGMYGFVLNLILKAPFQPDFTWATPWPWAMTIGMVLAVGFSKPDYGIVKRLVLGFADLPLNVVGKFGDVMSYIRLMAIGMAGTLLAFSFNDLAFSISAGKPILLPFTILVLILGHSLNFSLCLIALFAHGVRLNMLEFSTNFGMTWSGHAYRPFAAATFKET